MDFHHHLLISFNARMIRHCIGLQLFLFMFKNNTILPGGRLFRTGRRCKLSKTRVAVDNWKYEHKIPFRKYMYAWVQGKIFLIF